jgi:hypothetical protein
VRILTIAVSLVAPPDCAPGGDQPRSALREVRRARLLLTLEGELDVRFQARPRSSDLIDRHLPTGATSTRSGVEGEQQMMECGIGQQLSMLKRHTAGLSVQQTVATVHS